MKTIICVLTQKVNNLVATATDNFWGIGDMFRGIIGLYHLSKRLNCEFIVDISRHPIGLLLKQKDHAFRSMIQGASIPFIPPEFVDRYVQESLQTQDYVYLCTNYELNVFERTSCDEELRSIITDVLTPNSEFEQYILQQSIKLPFSEFDIFHYRLPDSEFDKPCYEYTWLLSQFQRNFHGQTCVVLSNSSAFKQRVEDSTNAFVFSEKLVHTGLEASKVNLQHTLYEFILLTKSSHIYTYSTYGWISGFVRIANYVYNVPLTVMK